MGSKQSSKLPREPFPENLPPIQVRMTPDFKHVRINDRLSDQKLLSKKINKQFGSFDKFQDAIDDYLISHEDMYVATHQVTMSYCAYDLEEKKLFFTKFNDVERENDNSEIYIHQDHEKSLLLFKLHANVAFTPGAWFDVDAKFGLCIISYHKCGYIRSDKVETLSNAMANRYRQNQIKEMISKKKKDKDMLAPKDDFRPFKHEFV